MWQLPYKKFNILLMYNVSIPPNALHLFINICIVFLEICGNSLSKKLILRYMYVC